jgi:hypothetical protein
LTGLTIGTNYFIRLKNTDANNNTSLSKESSFTTTNSTDIIAPVISNVTTTIVTDNEALISWSTDEASTGQVFYSTTSSIYNNSTNLNSTYNLNHSGILSGLSTSTKYYYVVVSADNSGNITTSTENNFTTLEKLSQESEVILREETAQAEGVTQGQASVPRTSSGGGSSITIDSTAPTISNADVTNITTEVATIIWDTNEDADSIVEYGEDTNYEISKIDLSYTKKHEIILKNLSPLTQYYYRIISSDISNLKLKLFLRK